MKMMVIMRETIQSEGTTNRKKRHKEQRVSRDKK